MSDPLEPIWARLFSLSRNPNASAFASFRRHARSTTAFFRRLIRAASRRARRRSAARPTATQEIWRDQDHRGAVQPLLSGKLPRADRHHLGLRRRLDAVLPDGRAAARRVDEPASGRTPGGLALRDRQTGWQGSLGWISAPKTVVSEILVLSRLIAFAFSHSLDPLRK